MKQLALITRPSKLKLFCRFNGEFHPKPLHDKLRYVGGETKVITVEKNITFLKLVTKIRQLCPNLKSFCVKYKLVLSDCDSAKDPPLVSIECDDDVKCMVEEFDERVKLYGNDFRIWLFVCCGEKKRCFCGKGSNGINSFDFPLIDLGSELSDECCGIRKENGKLNRDESFSECVKCPLNPRDENVILERNGFVHCVSRQSNVDSNGKHDLWSNGDIGKALVNTSNREKDMCSCQRVIGGNQNCIRHCKSGVSDPCLVPSDKNVVRVGKENHRDLQNGGNNSQCGVASSVDLLYNLSLSSSKEVESPALTSLECNGASKDLLKSEIKPPSFMDEGKVITSTKAEKPAAITSHHVSKDRPIIDKDRMPEEEIQQDPPSGLIVGEQVETKESVKGPDAIAGISNDLTALYSLLAAKELQAIKYSDLEFIKELGSGTYGTVYHGKWKGSNVAIKKLKPSCFTGGSLEEDRLVADFWKEARILGQLHHPNIVAFYGVVTDGPANNLATVTEYMVNGSLRRVLKRKDRTIDRRKRLIIAMDAAFGMEYLHEKNIVHFDLKSHNLLVNMKDPQRPICKIGDLGLSKIKKRTLVSGGVRGTIPWMAPELFNSKNMVTEKVDVYSFGIVMWELLTGEDPYANLRTEEIIVGIIKGTLRPEIPSWIDPAWRSLMMRCWSSNPDERPPFSEIAKELRAMAAAMNIK